jgi:hypothetical protein
VGSNWTSPASFQFGDWPRDITVAVLTHGKHESQLQISDCRSTDDDATTIIRRLESQVLSVDGDTLRMSRMQSRLSAHWALFAPQKKPI